MDANRWKRSILSAAALLTLALPSLAASRSGFEVEVLVAGQPRPEYASSGKVYVEALRGREYAVRLRNPYPCRVAVALSVDGLNTIDARRTDAASARKWVLEPYETVIISGWQVSGLEARKFYFTGEKKSYGAYLGQTDNLGVIEAAVFRERPRRVILPAPCPRPMGSGSADQGEGGLGGNVPEAAPSAPSREKAEAKAAPSLSDDYAATGIGGKMRHDVTVVSMELERAPCAVVSIRYEFRPQLVSLGVLPQPGPTPMERRRGATGFEQAYCPDPYLRNP